MPFEDDLETIEQPERLKKVSSKKSIFDDMPKSSSEEFEKKIKDYNNRSLEYKKKASEYTIQFKKILSNKTLQKNKSVFELDAEKELIENMVRLAVAINNDSNEDEGMGSLMWVILLLKTVFSQRDRINDLEYQLELIKPIVSKLDLSLPIK